MISSITFWVLFLAAIAVLTIWQTHSSRKNSEKHLGVSNRQAEEHALRMEKNFDIMERQVAALERIASVLEGKNAK